MEYLSRQEEMVLLAVFRLGEDPSLVNIRHYLNNTTEKHWSMSSVYIPLDRLYKSGHLKTEVGEPTPVRGGRAKKFYSLTEKGVNALQKVRQVNNTLWDGITDFSSTV